MKRFSTIATIALFGLWGSPRAASAQPAAVEEFQGFEFREKVGCINDPVSQVTYRWGSRGNQSSEQRQALRDSLTNAFPGTTSISGFTVSLQRASVIAVVRKTVDCGQWNGPNKVVHSLKFYSAADRQALMRKVEADVKQYKSILQFEVIEWIERPVGGVQVPFKRIGSMGVRG